MKNMKIHFISKHFLLIFTLFIVLSMSAGCGSKEETETVTGDSFAGKYTSAELYDIIASSMTDLPSMTVVYSNDDKDDVLSLLSEIDKEKVADYVFAYSMEGKPEEIAVIQLKSKEYVEQVKKNLEERIESRQNSFSVYTHDESELEKFYKAKVDVKSNYIIMIIGSQAANGKYEFEKQFK